MPASTRTRSAADDASTPSKRRKVEPGGEGATELGERSQDLWLEDGNVILVAHGMSFRVHKSILSMRSDVFKTLLEEVAPEQLESCPVVRVDDEGRDLHDLLHIIYNGGNSDWLSSKRPPIQYSDFRRVVHTAVKYDVQEVIAEAKYRLSRVFSTDGLDHWSDELQPDSEDTPLALCYLDCVDVLHISRLLNMRTITPLVFYFCCNINPAMDVVRGVKLDGVPGRITLSQDDLGLYLTGRAALTRESGRVMRVFQELAADQRARSSQCATLSHCRRALMTLSMSAVDDGLYSDPNPVHTVDGWLNGRQKKPAAKPCQDCDAALRTLLSKRRTEAWCQLGQIFGVEEWPAGKKDNANVPPVNNV